MTIRMTDEELRSLPPATDIVTGGRAFGLGRTKARELARNGNFPCRVIRVGSRYVVPRAAIYEALGIDTARSAAEIAGDAA